MPENSTANTKPTAGIRTNMIASIYDAGKPFVVQELCRRFGVQFAPFYRTWELMGREDSMESTVSDTWTAYEENRYLAGLKVFADVADPGVGNTTIFQLDPSFIGSAATGYAFYGREGEIVTIPGTNVQARIQTITGAGTANVFITLMPVSQTSNIGALTAGTELSITNGAWARGTTQPDGVRAGHTKRTFMLQILKETYGVEGNEMTDAQWIEATYDNDGNPIPYSVVNDMSVQTQLRLNSKINGAFLLGQMQTNPNLTQTTPRGATNYVRTTAGLYPTIAANGRVNIIPSGAFDVEDMDDIGIYMKAQGVTRPYALFSMGQRRYNEVENECKDYLVNTGADFLKKAASSIMGADPNDNFLHMGFSGMNKGGFNYLFKVIDELSDPEGLGRTGYDLDQYGFITPIEDIRNPKTKQMQKNIAVRYVKKGSYSRKYEMWTEGAAGGDTENYTGAVDEKLWYMRVNLGFQMLGMNQCQVIKP